MRLMTLVEIAAHGKEECGRLGSPAALVHE
jgi:hypothetical protein